MGLPCRVRVNYRGYAVAVHRRLCYPHVTSAAVEYGGWGYWTNGQRICLTRSRKTLRLLTICIQKNLSRATPVPGEAASWERTTTASSFISAPWSVGGRL